MASKKNKAAVEQLLRELGIPSVGAAAKGLKAQFKNLSLMLAILRTKKKEPEVISSLTIDLDAGDSVAQQILANGDFLVTLRLKKFK